MERPDSVTDRADDEIANPAKTFSKDGDSSQNEGEGETQRQDAQLPAKERRLIKKKQMTAEKLLTNVMQTFVDSQRDSEERFLTYEERRAKVDRSHENICFCSYMYFVFYPQVQPLHVFLLNHLFTMRVITHHTCNN